MIMYINDVMAVSARTDSFSCVRWSGAEDKVSSQVRHLFKLPCLHWSSEGSTELGAV